MIDVLPPRFAAATISERLTTALELLSLPGLAEQLAGIYALESLRRDDPESGGTVVEILSSFVRRRAAFDPVISVKRRAGMQVQAALSALGQKARDSRWENRPLDLHGIAIREAYLPLVHFERAFLYDCDLEGALLVGAHLEGAWLARTNLHNANLDEAHLEGTDLSDVHHLTPSQLTRAFIDSETRLPKTLKASPVNRRSGFG